ncbi:MAG TPA: hypothetical protein VMW91_05460 [Desulfosporosinus sp.]|nr:hypothetical protein [Desulfosporosinus sp.]
MIQAIIPGRGTLNLEVLVLDFKTPAFYSLLDQRKAGVFSSPSLSSPKAAIFYHNTNKV